MKQLFTLVLFVISGSIIAQDLDRYEKQTYLGRDGELPYRILLPKHYNPDIAYPLVLFLHGSGERGSDNSEQL